MKTCSHCKTTLPLDSFNVDATGLLGRRNECRTCVKRYTRSKHGLALRIYRHQEQSCAARGYSLPDYTEQELEQWLFNQPLFHSLYDQWASTGYQKQHRPSVDRINDYVSYTLSNIQLLTWEQNNQKNYASRVDGTNNKQSLAVDMLDLDGNFVDRFYSVSEAARRFSGIPSNIIGAIQNRTTRVKKPDGSYRYKVATQAYGHKWRYSTVPNTNTELF